MALLGSQPSSLVAGSSKLSGWLKASSTYTTWSVKTSGPASPSGSTLGLPAARSPVTAVPPRLPSVSTPSTADHDTDEDADADDELLTLDIDAALSVPSALSTSTAASSPIALRNLTIHAAELLRRFQTAYRRRVRQARALQDRLRDADTQTRHLRRQVDDLSVSMRHLADELAIRPRTPALGQTAECESCAAAADDVRLSRDLGSRVARHRGSTASSGAATFTSLENASVFSRFSSPTVATSLPDDSSQPFSPFSLPPADAANVHDAVLYPPCLSSPSSPQTTDKLPPPPSPIHWLFQGLTAGPRDR